MSEQSDQHLAKAHRALNRVSGADRYKRDFPKEPRRPTAPDSTIRDYLVSGSLEGQSSLLDLVNLALHEQGVDRIITVSSSLQEMLSKVRVEAHAPEESFDPATLTVVIESHRPNPQYKEQQQQYVAAMTVYEKECEEFAKQASAYAKVCAERKRILKEATEKAEYERLKMKFEKGKK